jgi:hypothetical protein
MARREEFSHDDRFELLCEAEERLRPEQVAAFRARLILALALHVERKDEFEAAIKAALPRGHPTT